MSTRLIILLVLFVPGGGGWEYSRWPGERLPAATRVRRRPRSRQPAMKET